MMWREYRNQAGVWMDQQVRRQTGLPAWVTWIALAVMLFVVALPVLIMLLLAGVLGAVVFGLLALWAWVLRLFAGLRMGSQGPLDEAGRRNVRVITPREEI